MNHGGITSSLQKQRRGLLVYTPASPFIAKLTCEILLQWITSCIWRSAFLVRWGANSDVPPWGFEGSTFFERALHLPSSGKALLLHHLESMDYCFVAIAISRSFPKVLVLLQEFSWILQLLVGCFYYTSCSFPLNLFFPVGDTVVTLEALCHDFLFHEEVVLRS